MITATKNNENNTNQISEMESGFSVSTKSKNGMKINKNGQAYFTIYGVRRQLMDKLLAAKTKRTEKLYIDTLIYLSEIKIHEEKLGLVDEYEDYSHPELNLELPLTTKIKGLFNRDRIIEIEEHIQKIDDSLMVVELKYKSAKKIKLISEGSFYTVSGEYADKVNDRIKVLRQRECNKLPFNSRGMFINAEIGEKNYLLRVLKEHDRMDRTVAKKNGMSPRDIVADSIKRMRKLRLDIERFNQKNMLVGKDIPDVNQHYKKHRLYSFVTDLPREYRNTMNYMNENGVVEAVVEYDIKASHTNFLPIVLSTMNDLLVNDPEWCSSKASLEIGKYKTLLGYLKVMNSDLYTKIAMDMKVSRDQIKGEWQEYVNDRKRAYRFLENNVWKWFKKEFPVLNNLIKTCHKIENNGTDKKTEWRNSIAYKFSIPLQLHKMENNLLVKPVVEEYRTVPSVHASQLSIITVHDSFLVSKSSSEHLWNILSKHNNINSFLSFLQYKSNLIDVCKDIKKSNSYMYMRSGCVLRAQNQTQETSNASGEGVAEAVLNVTTDAKGRMWCSVKHKRYGSRKNETKEQFLERVRGDKVIKPKEIMNDRGEVEMTNDTLQQNSEPIKEETVELKQTQPTEPIMSDEDNFFARIKAQFGGPTIKLRNIK